MCARRNSIYSSALHWSCAHMALDMRNTCPSRALALRSARDLSGDALRYEPMTPLDLLATAIRARASAPGSLVPPAAILWTDARREWGSLLLAARLHVPELLVLGDYSPDDRAGPAIWLRCVVDHTIELPDVPATRPP